MTVESRPLVIAGYPVRPLTVEVGALRIQLLMVKRLEDFVDTAALLRDADAPEPPYWAHLWAGSRALARLVATEVECAGRRTIEIGCGLGLVGIVAARRGAAVTMTDMALDAVRFARANAALNRCGAHAVQTDVRTPGIRGQFDYCFAADVTYDPALQMAVAAFLAAHLAPHGRAWCAESVRTFDQAFHDACAQHGLRTRERDVRESDDGRDVPVRITEVRWP